MYARIMPYGIDGVENLVANLLRAFQSLGVGMALVIGNIQSVFFSQIHADFSISGKIIPVRNHFGMVVYPAEHNMAVWMLFVKMPYNDVWRIGNSHCLHIFIGDFNHRLVIYFVLVVGMKIERVMAYGFLNFGSQGAVILKSPDYFLPVGSGQYI